MRRGVPTRDVVIFTRLFATMMAAGLPLVQSLNILGRQTANRSFREVIRRMVREVESGETLSGAMSRHRKVFSELSVSLVAAGETAGALDTILERIAGFLEKHDALGRKVRAALIYPSMIVAVTIPAVAILLIFVIPTFENMFSSAGVPLPLPTRLVIAASGLLQRYWWVLLGAMAAAGLLLRPCARNQPGTPRDRPAAAGRARAGRPAAQGGGLALHAHPGDAGGVRRVHPAGPGGHRADGRKPCDSRRRDEIAGGHREGRDHRAPARGVGGVHPDGGAHGGGGRANGVHSTRCWRGSRISTNRRWTGRWKR